MGHGSGMAGMGGAWLRLGWMWALPDWGWANKSWSRKSPSWSLRSSWAPLYPLSKKLRRQGTLPNPCPGASAKSVLLALEPDVALAPTGPEADQCLFCFDFSALSLTGWAPV